MRHIHPALCLACSLVWTTLLGALQPATSLAQASNDELARAHFQLGSAHYESGAFLKAAAEFEEAYRISQRPQLLYNIYLSYRDANDPQKAADALRDYLRLVGDAPNRAQLEAKLKALEKGLAEAAAAQANAPPGEAPAETPASEADPAEASGPTDETAPPSGVQLSAGSDGGGNKILPIALIAGGGALIVGAVVTGLMASSAQSTLEEECPSRMDCSPDLESTRSRGQTLALVTDILWIAGAAAAGTGAVLFLLGADKERSSSARASQPRASFACAPGTCSGSLRLSF